MKKKIKFKHHSKWKKRKSIYRLGFFTRLVVFCSLNNIFISILAPFGFPFVVYKLSAGSKTLHLKGSLKSTAFGSQIIGKHIGKTLVETEDTKLILVVKSRINFRIRGFIEGLLQSELFLAGVVVRYKKTHNGCRKKKGRRK